VTHRGIPQANPLTRGRLAVFAAGSLALSLGITACTQVAGSNTPTLVRFIDASYSAPAVNVSVEGQTIASNAGPASISNYGTLSPSTSAEVEITAATGGAGLAKTTAPFISGNQESVFFTGGGSAGNKTAVTVLEDQSMSAPTGESSFRFLNQAVKTGAVDVYMVPSTSTLAKSAPLAEALAAGTATGYLTFTSQTVTLVVTPAGSTKVKYTSQPLALTGGEVRTALIVDAALTSNPPVTVVLGDDVN
jgi:hypothetical protein